MNNHIKDYWKLLYFAIMSAKIMIKGVEMKTYMCVVCGLIYEEENGWPEDGIEPGTKWDDIPDDWVCPDCGVSKDEFEMMEI